MTQATYTIAKRNPTAYGPAYNPVKGIPRNMTRQQAESLVSKARVNGVDVVVYNTESI